MIGEIKYGGLVLKLTKVNDVRKDNVMSDDGMDYLYTAWTIDVTAVLNPAATSYQTWSQVNNEEFAGRTDRAIESWLEQPRRKFIMWCYDKDRTKHIYLETPQGDMVCDAKGGPFCKVVTIREVHGARTWIMNLQFTTFVNDCYEKNSPILSHRWERNVDSDEQHRAIVTTSGIVVFHAGRLYSEDRVQSPDFYRHQFFQPPPENFAREHVNVNVSSDNCVARYTVVDVERFFNVGGVGDLGGPSPAVKVDANLTTWCGHGSVGNALAANAPGFGAAMRNALPSGADLANTWGYIGRLLRDQWNLGQQVMGSTVAELPKFYANIKVRAHGARNSLRKDLAEFVLAIAFSRLGKPSFWNLANRSEIIMNQDLTDTFVEVDFTLRWMDQTRVQLAGAFGPAAAAGSMLPILFEEDMTNRFFNGFLLDAKGVYSNNTYMNVEPLTNPGLQPPRYPIGKPLLDQNYEAEANTLKFNRPMNTSWERDRHSRGIGLIRKIMVQALKGECEVPPIPGYRGNSNLAGGTSDLNFNNSAWDTGPTPTVAATVKTRNFPLLPQV